MIHTLRPVHLKDIFGPGSGRGPFSESFQLAAMGDPAIVGGNSSMGIHTSRYEQYDETHIIAMKLTRFTMNPNEMLEGDALVLVEGPSEVMATDRNTRGEITGPFNTFVYDEDARALSASKKPSPTYDGVLLVMHRDIMIERLSLDDPNILSFGQSTANGGMGGYNRSHLCPNGTVYRLRHRRANSGDQSQDVFLRIWDDGIPIVMPYAFARATYTPFLPA